MWRRSWDDLQHAVSSRLFGQKLAVEGTWPRWSWTSREERLRMSCSMMRKGRSTGRPPDAESHSLTCRIRGREEGYTNGTECSKVRPSNILLDANIAMRTNMTMAYTQ